MFRSNSPFMSDASMSDTNTHSFLDETSSQASAVSRPSAKLIYMQRKEYATSINKMLDGLQYRVEHLFTCELDGKEVKNTDDCVERLELLDGMGRVWAQSMRMEVRGGHLLLRDTETKEDLEVLPLGDVQELRAVMAAGPYDSLLLLVVGQRQGRGSSVFMFQCEDHAADHIQRHLSRALRRRPGGSSRSSSSTKAPPGGRGEPQMLREQEADVHHPPIWATPDYAGLEDQECPSLQEEEAPSPPPSMAEEELPPPLQRDAELQRKVDVLNQIFNEVEIFMGQVAAAAAKGAKKKSKKDKAAKGTPTEDQFAACLQKIKCGFNLLAELDGRIQDPSAADLVHSLFSSLDFVASHCPEDLPPTIVDPLLTPACLGLLSHEASAEEEQLWRSLGDGWGRTSNQDPEDEEDLPTFTLDLVDDWQALKVKPEHGHSAATRGQQVASKQSPAPLSPRTFPPPCGDAAPHSCVLHDFVARNPRELTISKGETVEVLDTSKQWWRVRDSRGQEGFVPHNVLEVAGPREVGVSPVLTRTSKPAQVKAWLEEQGFSRITVRSLAMLSGAALLGMSRDELKEVCPQEGRRVFSKLQDVKAAAAVRDATP